MTDVQPDHLKFGGYGPVRSALVAEMFIGCTHSDDNSDIFLVATDAFRMGMCCRNVGCVIHWGPLSDIEAYLQETGHAGRDGLQASVILYWGRSQSHANEKIKAN